MKRRSFIVGAAMLATALAFAPASAQDFNWRAQDGQTINLMFNNHPWSQAMRDMVADFHGKDRHQDPDGDLQRGAFLLSLTTLMQGRSSDMDVFMSRQAAKGPSSTGPDGTPTSRP